MVKQSKTLDSKYAADYLGISYWTLLNLCKQGVIPHIRIGSKYLFRMETLDRFLSDQEILSVSNNETSGQYGQIRQIKE
jgi:excisionase family DNA binding protein